MLTNEDIVYISNDWARENKTSAHHIAEVLSVRNRVLYVEAAGMRSPRVSGRDFRKIVTKLTRFFSRPKPLQNNLFLFSPSLIPFHRYAFVRSLNRLLLAKMLNRACKTIGFRKPIIWIYMPHFASAVETLENKGVVYYCTDEYSSNPKVDPETIRRLERVILEKADVAFVVSQRLLESKAPHNANTYLSRHGVDVGLFSQAMSESTRVPEDIARIPRPIAGFFGLLEEWIDTNLIAHVANALPDVSFVFIGRIARDMTSLQHFPNVHLLGHRKYESLAGYLKAFDVCMLVYKQGEFSKHANPKKLREYLAGGKPIVSVRLGEVEEYQDFVKIADSYEDFARLIAQEIREDTADKRMRRLEAVKENSWEAKVEWLGQIIGRHIPLSVAENESVDT